MHEYRRLDRISLPRGADSGLRVPAGGLKGGALLCSRAMERPYDAILLDLDGTLLGPDERISDRNREALSAAREAGAEVMVATGRSKISALPVLAELGLDAPAALFNGCAVWCPKSGRMLEERLLSNRTNGRLHAWAEESEAQVIVMTADEKFALEPRNAGEERNFDGFIDCLLYTSPSPRDQRGSRMPSSA